MFGFTDVFQKGYEKRQRQREYESAYHDRAYKAIDALNHPTLHTKEELENYRTILDMSYGPYPKVN